MSISHSCGKEGKPRVRAEAIRTAALRLFVAEGYGSVSLRRIADVSGIQVGSLYNHIDSKQQLLFELIYEAEQNLFDALKRSVSEHLTPTKQMMAYIEQYFIHASSNRELHLLAVREKRCLEDGDASRLRALLLKHEQLIHQILERGVHAGAFAIPSYAFATKAIWCLLDGMLNSAPSNRSEVLECAALLKGCVIRGLVADVAC